jgi:glycosyltransferase involved in cell wall biosynthesis
MLAHHGVEVERVTPETFPTVPFPTYPEVRLACFPFPQVERRIRSFSPDAIHIATEATLGMTARHYCLKYGIPFTTSFHTRFPDYLYTHMRVPKAISFAFLKRFHRSASAVMVSTSSLRRELRLRGFRRLRQWSRGVDTQVFQPGDKAWLNLPRPVLLYVGRVAPEKNLEAFLSLPTPGTKLVVGGGPQLALLKVQFPEAVFVGEQRGADLARYYAASDVLVFPSKTDTFGLVMLEALACGIPVAAFPVQGPLDVLGRHSQVGCLSHDLGAAIQKALQIPPERCRPYALRYSWEASARQFYDNLCPLNTHAASAGPHSSSRTHWLSALLPPRLHPLEWGF